MRVCIVGASGTLGWSTVRHALDRGSEVVGVRGERSGHKLGELDGRITVGPGRTDDPGAIGHAVAGCDRMLTVVDAPANDGPVHGAPATVGRPTPSAIEHGTESSPGVA